MRRDAWSWGRLSVQPHERQALYRREWVAAQLAERPGGIAHGLGRSYGDQALNDGGLLWDTRGLDRFIAFDSTSGVLRCEAGVSLAEIAALVLPQGWFLPVMPGTGWVTLGGAIANDVHGKNHQRRGSFGEHVLGLTLARSDGQIIECGPGHDADWHRATIGGMGLTGVITDATLQLMRVDGMAIESQSQPFATLAEFLRLSGAADSEGWEYSVAWIDALATRGDSLRGIFFRGRHAAGNGPTPQQPRAWRVPFTPPLSPLAGPTLRLFNRLYHARQSRHAGAMRQESWQAFFHPLDQVDEWNRLYGPRGLVQYQCVLPRAVQREATGELLRGVAEAGQGSFLGVLKCFGERPSAGLLGFAMPGITVALDFPHRGAQTLALFERLDAIVQRAGGRLYMAKDARMPRAMFEAGYPEWPSFERYRDPGLSSAMSRRLFGH